MGAGDADGYTGNAERRTNPFEHLDVAHARASRAERELLRAILECDRRELWRTNGCRDHAEFLAGRYGISKWKARRWIGAAYALEHLALTSHALSSGMLGIDKAVELTRFATPGTEKKLIAWARRVTPAAVRARADQETRRSLARAQKAEDSRHLRWWWDVDGSGLEIEGRLAPKGGPRSWPRSTGSRRSCLIHRPRTVNRVMPSGRRSRSRAPMPSR